MNPQLLQTDTQPGASEFADTVDALADAHAELSGHRRHVFGAHPLPSRDAVGEIMSDLRAVLFPAHFGPPSLPEQRVRAFIGERLDVALFELQEQVRRGMLSTCPHGGIQCLPCTRRAYEVTQTLARRLPEVRALLGTDVRAAYDGDPAATSVDEAVFCYPGVSAVIHHRIAHELYELQVPLLPRIISELAHASTGIDIHPGAKIGGSFFIDHGTGVVIGETSIIGERVRLYQGVTLGARSFPSDEHGHPIKGRPRHPIVGDDVTIYAGATILGRITIGRGSTIGGNVWLTRGVPARSHITQAQARDDLFDGGAGI